MSAGMIALQSALGALQQHTLEKLQVNKDGPSRPKVRNSPGVGLPAQPPHGDAQMARRLSDWH